MKLRAMGERPRAAGSSGDSLPARDSLASRLRSISKVVRTIIGAPDYERYVAHIRQCHPDRVPLTRDEFARERLQARYSQPGNRCC